MAYLQANNLLWALGHTLTDTRRHTHVSRCSRRTADRQQLSNWLSSAYYSLDRQIGCRVSLNQKKALSQSGKRSAFLSTPDKRPLQMALNTHTHVRTVLRIAARTFQRCCIFPSQPRWRNFCESRCCCERQTHRKTRPALGAQPRDLFKLGLLVVWLLSPSPSKQDEPLTASYLPPKRQIWLKSLSRHPHETQRIWRPVVTHARQKTLLARSLGRE